MKWGIGILFALVCGSKVAAQTGPMVVTEPKAAFRVLFNFDFRRTFVNSEPVRFYGFRLGAQRNKDVIAVGFYGLGDPYVQPEVDLGSLGVRELTTNFDYTSLTYERLLLETKRWTIGVPVSVGLGNYRTGYRDSTDATIPFSTNELVPLEASLHVDYNILWWLFIGVGGGYRHVLAADRNTTITLSDVTYYFKAGLRAGEMLKRARKEFRKNNGT
ncbi:MAG: hypothetical protein R2815_03195 [Flavobacteriales bacterium]